MRKAMVLAAGVGSRLRPLTETRPKPLVPLLGKPVMEHLLLHLSKHGIEEVMANLWYRGDMIEDYFGDGSRFGVSLSYSKEKELLGTAGGVKKVEKFFDSTFLVIAGDAATDVNITRVLEFHKKVGAIATIALKPVPWDEVPLYGVVVTDGEGRIKNFQEKPKREEAKSNLVNTGIYIFELEIFKFIPEGMEYDFGKQVFPELVKVGAPFYGFPISDEEYWNDVGSLEVYRWANLDALTGKIDIDRSYIRQVDTNIYSDGEIKIKKGARVEGPVFLGDGTIVDEGALIVGPAVLGRNARVSRGSVVERCVIWDGTILENGALAKESVIGEHVIVGRGAEVERAYIADGVNILPGTKVLPDTRIWPGISISGEVSGKIGGGYPGT